MFRYEVIANVAISVDLHNNYSVIALAKWEKEKNCYSSQFYIKENDIDHLDLIDNLIGIEFESDIKTIKTDLAKFISGLYENGSLDRYAERYKYELKCIDKGTALFESERKK